jgi:hypothetical protein
MRRTARTKADEPQVINEPEVSNEWPDGCFEPEDFQLRIRKLCRSQRQEL